MRAQILSIGSELILGHLTDTNATYLAQQLASLGIDLTLVTQVGDDLPLLASVIDRASLEADVVICTGGVGPTTDDLTREAIAQVLGEEPRVDETLFETVRSFFRARGIEMPERNSKQAWLVPSAEPIPNPVGTAPGWFARKDGRTIVAMPGVPREMFRMWAEQVVPRLAAMMSGQSVCSTTIKTIGIGESAAEQVLADLVTLENPVVATYAKDDGVHIRVTAKAESEVEATRLRDETSAEVTNRLADHVYGADSTTLPQALATLLQSAGHKVAICDSGGGGRFASLLASDQESSEKLSWSSMVPMSNGPAAVDLALTSLNLSPDAALGVGIAVEATALGNDVYEGSIFIAVRGAILFEETSTIRSGFEDIQRRSALVAADVLRRTLLSTH
jgi:nicotinamide-nucleotide amidase